jgi:hypothetical protein
MKATNLAAVLGAIGLALLAPASAHAQAWEPWPMLHGNDTGGIIPWSCENEAWAPRAAAGYCARFNKYSRITGVNRQYGDYISFNCLWSPYVDRDAHPAVAMRSACIGPQQNILTK